ncbi:MAG: hypothetical protein J6S85_13745 [Methanobrevibacter sp.]|nr:hypothetical protein [Methanobrevibacter sp.]
MYTFIDGNSSSTSTGDKKKIVTISVDTESDIPEPENDWGCGSVCWIINTNTIKMLNSQGEWK